MLVYKIMPLGEIVHHATPRKKAPIFCRLRARKARTQRRRQRRGYVVSTTRCRSEERETRRVAGNKLREMIDCISSLHLRGGSHVAPPPPHPNPVVFQPTATRCYYSRCCLISGFVTNCTAASRRAAPLRQTRSRAHFLHPPFGGIDTALGTRGKPLRVHSCRKEVLYRHLRVYKHRFLRS